MEAILGPLLHGIRTYIIIMRATSTILSLLALVVAVHSRSLLQPASSSGFAAGSNQAVASAFVSNVNGQGRAGTASSATGGGAIAAGISQAEVRPPNYLWTRLTTTHTFFSGLFIPMQGQVNTCIQGPSNSAECITLAPQQRSSFCSDIPPDNRFSCYQQAVEYGKCDQGFMFEKAYCLRSCNRCGGKYQY